MSAGSKLVAFITGQQPGLSEEAQRGRKEVIWISASVWLPPIAGLVRSMISAPGAEIAGSLLPSAVVNAVLFFMLARGDPGARPLTLLLLVPAAIAHLLSPFLPYSTSPGVLTGLFNGLVYAAAYVLARSPAVQAYLDSQTGHISIPSRAPRLPGGRRAATLPSPALPAPDVKPPPA